MSKYTLIISDDTSQVFKHPIPKGRSAEVVKIAIAPESEASPEQQLFAEKRISQRVFNGIVKNRLLDAIASEINALESGGWEEGLPSIYDDMMDEADERADHADDAISQWSHRVRG